MGFIVKNTTFCGLSDLICPHSCRGCGAIGSILCECCKNDIIEGHINYCLYCGRQVTNQFICNCRKDTPPTFAVGWRDELIGKLVQDYKYNSVLTLGKELANILDETLPFIDGDVVIVPLPTINRHVRRRNLDHTFTIAKNLAKKRGWNVERVLKRAKNTVQVGSDVKTRILQAVQAYDVNNKLSDNKIYILLDDVWTTGSSMKAAIKKLQQAGASKIIVVVLSASRRSI